MSEAPLKRTRLFKITASSADSGDHYRGTSLIRNRLLLRPYRSPVSFQIRLPDSGFRAEGSQSTSQCRRGVRTQCLPCAGSFRSFRFFELPTQADTGNGSVERPCFRSDHIKPPCTPGIAPMAEGIAPNASVAFLVSHHRGVGYRGRGFGFNAKHQSTK